MAGYREAGVDLEGAERHVATIAASVTATWGRQVMGPFGGFAAGVELPEGYRRPVLMLTTDGVGTKLELARQTGLWHGVGADLVAMCVDDLAAVGAHPLGFVDYLAVGRLDTRRDAAIVASVATACTAAGVPLLGGETAEHPGVMDHDQVDLAGAALGVVEHDDIVTGEAVRAGDIILGLGSPNLRSNGFSLVRRLVAGTDLSSEFPGEDRSWGEVLLEPSMIYAPACLEALDQGGIHALAHVTGGGIAGNLSRVLPEGCRAEIDRSSWEVPSVFRVLQHLGSISEEEMARTFNLGLGYLVVVDPGSAESVNAAFARRGHQAFVVGRVRPGVPGVDLS